MATYDSADCLAKFRKAIRQPSTSDFPTDAEAYEYLGQGQIDIYTRLSTYCPAAIRSAPAQMTTADSGYTYTFGTDADGNNKFPIGQIRIFRTRPDNPDTEMIPVVEFLLEGNTIRMPDFTPFTGAAPYYYGVVLPLTLTSGTAPTLIPVQAREMIIDAASVRYALDADDGKVSDYSQKLEQSWNRWIGTIQSQYASAGAIAASHPGALPARFNFYGMGRGLFR